MKDPRNLRGYENLKEILGKELGEALYDCVNHVFEYKENEQLQFAVQQFIGFTSALTCNKIISLVESMGLTREEWLFIIDKESYLFCESQLEEINKHFNIK